MNLLSDEVLALSEPIEPDSAGFDCDLLADDLIGRPLRNFLILTQFPERFSDWTAEQIFWSRYYWFLRFVRVRAAKFGTDVGLEQQASDRLAHPEPACVPDSRDREWVAALADRDAAHDLRPAWDDSSSSHRIVPAEVRRLATMAGVTDRDEWGRQIAAEPRIPALVTGDIRQAWQSCLPVWLEQGRVRDLARGIQVP